MIARGRKPIYNLDALEIGEKLPLKGKVKKFAKQYVRNFNTRKTGSGHQFKHVIEEGKIFIERVS